MPHPFIQSFNTGHLKAVPAIVVAVLYFVLGHLSFAASASNLIVTPVFFAPEGISIAATILFGPIVVPGVFVGQLALAVSRGLEFQPSVLISLINASEAWLTAIIFHRIGIDARMRSAKDLSRYLILVSLFAVPYSATLGNGVLWMYGKVTDWSSIQTSWLSWWQGNLMAEMILGPMLLTLMANWSEKKHKLRRAVLPLIVMVPAALISFSPVSSGGIAVALVIFMPLLIWIADRGGLVSVSLACSLLATFALYKTSMGVGPFVYDGFPKLLDLNVFIMGMAISSQFVAILNAERKRAFAENSLLLSKLDRNIKQMEAVLESSSVGIVFSKDRVIQFANRRAAGIFGYEPEQMMAMPIRQFYPNDESYEQVGVSSQAMIRQGKRFVTEMQLRRKSGSTVWVRLYGQSIDYRDPESGVIWVIEDIREQKRYLEEIHKAKREADLANQAKSQFLANMSHEIRTPLNAVVGNAYLLESTHVTEEQKDYLTSIQVASQNLMDLINDILDFSKIEAGQMQLEQRSFHLCDLLNDVKAICGSQAVIKNLDLAFDLPPERLPELIGDEPRVRQMMINLVSNAIKFTPAGFVKVSSKVVGTQDHLIRVRIEVQDSGIGIAPEIQNQLFQPFTQADSSTTRKFGGTGLGLSLVRELALLMNGTVGLSSEVGRGSCFWFEIELGRGQAEHLNKPEMPIQEEEFARSLRDLRVLVVDDSLVNLEMCKRLLEKRGIQVSLCENGKEAVDLLGQDSKFDAVLMDLQMPVMGGHEATRIIRNELGLRDLPILALTAAAREGERNRALEAGMDDFLTKPINPMKLLKALFKHVGPNHSEHNTKYSHGSVSSQQGEVWPTLVGIDTERLKEKYGDDLTGVKERLLGQVLVSEQLIQQIGDALQQRKSEEIRRRAEQLSEALRSIGADSVLDHVRELNALCDAEVGIQTPVYFAIQLEFESLAVSVRKWANRSSEISHSAS